jgi:hypothetical protein
MKEGSNYTWTQSKVDLTLHVDFPIGTTVREVTCCVAHGTVTVGLKGAEPLVCGELWEPIISSVWSFESPQLTVELDKKTARFWPCALHGDPELDVSELVAKEKREKEPAYKPDPHAETKPQRVTDRETLAKIKAEFPQLDIGLGEKPHIATHKAHAGPRKTFDWGPMPSTGSSPSTSAATAGTVATATSSQREAPPVPSPPQGIADGGSQPSADRVTSAFSWGMVPPANEQTVATAAPTAAPGGAPQLSPSLPSEPSAEAVPTPTRLFSWGPIPTTPSIVPIEPTAAAHATAAVSSRMASQPARLPARAPEPEASAEEPGQQTHAGNEEATKFSWGALPY